MYIYIYIYNYNFLCVLVKTVYTGHVCGNKKKTVYQQLGDLQQAKELYTKSLDIYINQYTKNSTHPQ